MPTIGEFEASWNPEEQSHWQHQSLERLVSRPWRGGGERASGEMEGEEASEESERAIDGEIDNLLRRIRTKRQSTRKE